MLQKDPDWFVLGGGAVTSCCPWQVACHTSWVAALPWQVAFPWVAASPSPVAFPLVELPSCLVATWSTRNKKKRSSCVHKEMISFQCKHFPSLKSSSNFFPYLLTKNLIYHTNATIAFNISIVNNWYKKWTFFSWVCIKGIPASWAEHWIPLPEPSSTTDQVERSTEILDYTTYKLPYTESNFDEVKYSQKLFFWSNQLH